MSYDHPMNLVAPAIMRPAPKGYQLGHNGLYVPKAKSAMLPGMFNPMLAACLQKGPPTISKVDNTSNTSGASTYTFSARNFGDGQQDRYIAIAVALAVGSSARTISGVTIGGVAATQAVAISNNTFANTKSTTGIFIALVPNGSSGDVVVTLSGGASACGIGIFKITGLSSTTPYATNVNNSGQNQSLSVNVPANGVVIGVQEAPTATGWTGLTAAYSDATTMSRASSGGYGAFVAAQSPLAVTAIAGGNLAHSSVIASWGP